MGAGELGYGLALVILFFFLLLPLLPSTSVAIDRWQAQLPVSFTAAWRVGTISDAHSQFGAQCSTCHERPFTAISDAACLKCHQNNTPHRVSATTSSPTHQQAACSTCHLEHQGRHKLVLHDAQQCVACHADIQGQTPAAKVANVRDFGEDHPEFHLTLSTGTQTTRVSQSDPGKLKENPALKFSHKVHLDKAGLSTPDGEKVMKCPDCHKLDPAARRFMPITMRTTCQQSECHSPDYSLPAKGPVVHGTVKQVMSSLQLFYARWLSQSPANMASCELRATASNQKTRIVDCAFDLARKNAGENLLGGKSRCGECHDIQPSDDAQAPWSIASPQIQRDWHAACHDGVHRLP
ncbi:MAG: forkhead-associated protein [Comamonadaceae bacterium]|nr:MAG: forkhead-associated protein [Comamonadaceae bacterium]